MSNLNRKQRLLGLGATTVIVIVTMVLGARAQDRSTRTVRHGESSYDTTVRNAEIVYVEGNDLVLKLEDGKVEHLVIPEEDKFTVDGKEVNIHGLAPGTKLTQTITTTATPHYVNTVRTIEGKVWHVNAPTSVLVSFPDGTNQVYKVPDHAKFTVGGESKTVFDLRKGMNFKATIVTDEAQTAIAQSKSVVGQTPRLIMPRMVGVLLFAQPTPEPAFEASSEQPEPALPETGTALPLVGMLGGLAIVLSLGLKYVRQAQEN
jgi:hypothetical protein